MDDLVLLSNRGPLSWSADPSGQLVAKRGSGGLVSGLSPLVEGTGAVWIAAAMSEGDREAARTSLTTAHGLRVELVDIDPATYRMAYEVVANATLWFVHHGLFDLTRRPRFDRRFRQAWEAFREYNQCFAQAAADVAPKGATVLIQDYHLALVAPRLLALRPDVSTVHFSHTPFADPAALAVLPDAIAVEMLEGMAAARSCGFHAQKWADRFTACCQERLGQAPGTFVAPLGPDLGDLERVATSQAARSAQADLASYVGDRSLIVRVDRIEPSKNLLRGLYALDELFRTRPDVIGKVVMLAMSYPSREGLAEYLAYRAELETLVGVVNETWGTPEWSPVRLETSDNFPRSIAALKIYDILLVAPVRDGLNLVAKEGPALNEADGVVVLSREAGAYAELGGAAIGVNPFDVTEIAEAMAMALDMAPDERRRRADALKELAVVHTPTSWLEAQLKAV